MILLIGLLILLPGVGATMAFLDPGATKIPTQLACVFGLGYVISTSWALILVSTHQLHAASFFAGLCVITSIMWVVGLRRSGLNARFQSLRAEIAKDGIPILIGAVCVTIMIVALVHRVSPLLNYGVANPFRYWADAREIADAGGVPTSTLQWGAFYPPTVSKLGFNAFNAAFSSLSDDPNVLMGPLLAFAFIGSVLGGWALGREIGLRYLAPLLAVLSGPGLFSHSLIISPQGWYSGETFARQALLIGMALAIAAMHDKEPTGRIALAAGMALGVAGTTHLIPTSIGIAFLVVYLFSLAVARRNFWQTARLGLVATTVFAAFIVAALALSGGDPGIGGARAGTSLETRGGTFDPTRYLATGRAEQPPALQPKTRTDVNGGWYDPPGTIFTNFVGDSFKTTFTSTWAIALLVGIFVGAIATFVISAISAKAAVVAALSVWLSLLAVALVTARLYDTYVPADFPQRRLWQFDTFMLILIAVIAFEALIGVIRSRQESLALFLTIALLIASLVLVHPRSFGSDVLVHGDDSLRALNWVSEHLPCDARILTNQRSGGLFQAITGRVDVVEGMAPYVRPGMLGNVTTLLLDARRFFRGPKHNLKVLKRYDVGYVLAAKKPYLIDTSPQLLGNIKPSRLLRIDGLDLIHSSSLMDVYRVTGSDPSGGPQAIGRPGYRCRTTPLVLPAP